MPRITEVKKIYRQRTEQEMRNSLQAFIQRKQTLHIPPSEEDDDFVLSDAIAELIEARKIIAGFLSGAGAGTGATLVNSVDCVGYTSCTVQTVTGHMSAGELRLYEDMQILPEGTIQLGDAILSRIKELGYSLEVVGENK